MAWSLTDIVWDNIDKTNIEFDPILFKTVASSSLLESTVSVYAQNLKSYYHNEQDFAEWISEVWEPEELRHAAAMAQYLQRVWPGFNSSAAANYFHKNYLPLCQEEKLEPSFALEALARCVVETGTASLYRLMSDYSDCPVLKQLFRHMYTDEVKHYKYFLAMFNHYNHSEKLTRFKIGGTIITKLKTFGGEEIGECADAIVHGWQGKEVVPTLKKSAWNNQISAIMGAHFPNQMAAKMLLKPLRLPSFANRFLINSTKSIMRLQVTI